MQLLDTLKHAACVFREPAKGEPFVGRGATEHILPDAQIFVRLKYVSVGTSGRRRDLIFLSKKVLVPSWAKRKRFVGLPLISASGASPQGEAEKAFSCGEGGARGATEGEDKKALSLSHFVTAPSQMEPKSWTAA